LGDAYLAGTPGGVCAPVPASGGEQPLPVALGDQVVLPGVGLGQHHFWVEQHFRSP
jgi:hypothetical protein